MTDLTPREIVSELDRFIIGQKDAKRAVAVALRSRWRRKQLASRIARRSVSQEYPDDRPDRGGQDRDQPPFGQAGEGPVRQDRGHEIHRSGLCRPRCGADHPRSDRQRHCPDPRADARRRQGPRASGGRRSGDRRDRRKGCTRSHARDVPPQAAGGRAGRDRDRDRCRRYQQPDGRDVGHARPVAADDELG